MGTVLAKGDAQMQQRPSIRAVSIWSGRGAVDAAVAEELNQSSMRVFEYQTNSEWT